MWRWHDLPSKLTKCVQKDLGLNSGLDSCGMGHPLVGMKREISDGGNPLLSVSLTPSTITVMGEFRYHPSDRTGLRVRADFLTGQPQSDTAAVLRSEHGKQIAKKCN